MLQLLHLRLRLDYSARDCLFAFIGMVNAIEHWSSLCKIAWAGQRKWLRNNTLELKLKLMAFYCSKWFFFFG